MEDEATYGLSGADARTFRKLVHAERTRPQNPRGLPGADLFMGDAGDVYIALIPAAGIRGRDGRKVYSEVCDVWRIVQEAPGTGTGTGGPPTGTGTHAYPQFVLGLAAAEQRAVYNISDNDVLGGTFVSIGLDSFGTWHVLGSGGGADSGGRVLLRTMPGAVAVPGELGTGCQTGTGTGLGNDECGLIYYPSEVYEPDPLCQDYLPTGEFVWAADILGRRLEPDRFYWGDFAGVPGAKFEAVLVPADATEVFTPDQNSPLYLIDIGTPSRTIKPNSKIGKLCITEETGTGLSGVGVGVDAIHRDLIVYTATVYRRYKDMCSYELIEPCLVANGEGCELDITHLITGTFHRMIPKRIYPGMHSERCLPLYITTDRKLPRTVGDVRCESGTIKVYFVSTDGCETELEYGHDAGCCDCGGTDIPATGTGAGCWCDNKPTSTDYTVSSFALTAGSCLDIGGCPNFPASFVVTRVGGSCVWRTSTLFSPCGGSLGATLTVNSDGSADLDIGGGLHDVTASYHTAGPWNCNGSNSMDFVSNGAGCGNWPASITVAP